MSATPHTPAPETAAPPDDRIGRSVVAVVSFLVFIEVCSGVLQGTVPSVTPLIGTTLKVSSGDLNWVNSLPLLVSGISVPLLAKLGDAYGHRRMIRITMVIVAIGSVIVATSDSFGLLLAGRALQGVFIAWLPLEFAIVRDRVDPKRAGAAIGLLVGALTVGGTLGSLGIGLLSKQVSGMHGLLWLPAGFILACLPVVFFLIPESTTRNRARIDWLGATLLSLGLGAGLLALARGGTWGWSSGTVLALVVAAVVLLAAFVTAELRIAQPLVDVRMIASRSMAPLYALSFILGCALYGSQTASATFMATPSAFGFGFGFDVLDLSLIALPTSVGMLLAATVADRLSRTLGPRQTVAGGFALATLGYLGMTFAHAHPWQFVVTGTLIGLGIGLLLGSLPTLIMAGLPADQTAIGTGLYNTLKALAGSVVGAVFAALMDQYLLKLPIPGLKLANEHGYVLVWTCCAAIALAGVLIALAVRTPHADKTTAQAPVTVPAAT